METPAQPIQTQAPQIDVPLNIEPPQAPQVQPKAKEPVLVIPTGKQGNQPIADIQYKMWIEDLRPFLIQGNSLNYCIDKADITKHRTAIYDKYRLSDWFAEQIDRLRAYPGELVNKIIVNLIMKANDDIANDRPLTKEQQDMIKFFAEKHRTAQPFFVTRTETAQADPKKIGKILDNLENTQSDYDQLGQEAKKQMVAANPPIQNKG